MRISGSLEDVGIAEVMQVIHFGARTGRLAVAGAGRHGEIVFVQGQVVQAWAEGADRLGDVLVRQGVILERELGEALEAQRTSQPKRELGLVLLDRGSVSMRMLTQALRRQVQGAVRQIVGWRQGSFSFEVAGEQAEDVGGRSSAERVAGFRCEVPALLANLNAESAEHDDTRPMAQRPSAQPLPAGNVRVGPWSRDALAAELSPPGEGNWQGLEVAGGAVARPLPQPVDELAPWPEIRLLSADLGLYSGLCSALGEETVTVTLGERLRPDGEAPVLVVLDARGARPEELASVVQRSRPVPVVAVVGGPEDTVRAYEAGVTSVVPAELEAMVACVRRLAHASRPPHDSPSPEESRTVMDRLRRFHDEVRSGLYSATVSLSLMNIVAESSERGILFLARQEDLMVLGAFGSQWPAGSPLSSLLRDFRLEGHDAALLRRLTLDGLARVAVDELPEALLRRIGPPRGGEAALVPVVGQQALVALMYVDNGALDVPLRELDLLEVATAQVGLAFENELLRRQLRDRRR